MTFLSSVIMQRERIGKQFKETVQKHSNLIYTTHKTRVPGWHSVVSQKALHLHPWASIMLFNMDKFCSKHNSSKFAQQSDVYGQVGSLRSCLCLQTNFTYFPLTTFGNWNILCPVPERSILTVLLVWAGAPATQYRPRCRIRLNSILCYQSDVSGFFVKWYFGRAIRIQFLRGKKMMSHIMYNNPEWPLHFTGASLDKHLLQLLYLLHLLHFEHFKNCFKNKCTML